MYRMELISFNGNTIVEEREEILKFSILSTLIPTQKWFPFLPNPPPPPPTFNVLFPPLNTHEYILHTMLKVHSHWMNHVEQRCGERKKLDQ